MRCEKHTDVLWMRVERLGASPYIETGVDSMNKVGSPEGGSSARCSAKKSMHLVVQAKV
jgi:hypothetical protein